MDIGRHLSTDVKQYCGKIMSPFHCSATCMRERERNFTLFNDDIIGVRGTWPSFHYVPLGIVNTVGTGGRPPTCMGWSENKRDRERERGGGRGGV